MYHCVCLTFHSFHVAPKSGEQAFVQVRTFWRVVDILCLLAVDVISDRSVKIIAKVWPCIIPTFGRNSFIYHCESNSWKLRPYVSLSHNSHSSFLCLETAKVLFLLKYRCTQNKQC